MRVRIFLLAAVVGCLAGPRAAQAQTGLVRITIDGGSQTTTTSFTQTGTFDEFVEQGSFAHERTIPKRPFYDVGVAVRVWKRLHVGVVGSVFTDDGAGGVTAQLPHPLYFNQRRTVNGPAEPSTRRETAAHIQASWTLPVRPGLELTVGGGPSIFQAKQIFVTKVNYTHEYPFDSATFTRVTTETVRNRVNGYNIGGDVTWRFLSHLGVGTTLRYSRGRKTFAVTGGGSVPITLGGFHAGGGLRLIF